MSGLISRKFLIQENFDQNSLVNNDTFGMLSIKRKAFKYFSIFAKATNVSL